MDKDSQNGSILCKEKIFSNLDRTEHMSCKEVGK